jgi:ribose 5-phosphate isomerase B
MKMMKIFLGSDHGGYELKQKISCFLQQQKKYEVIDLGCEGTQSCDYPMFGEIVAQSVVKQKGSKGIVCCGSGIGISMAANKVKGARAALCNSLELATLSRQHNDANILAMGGRTKFFDQWQDIVQVFLMTDPDSTERHAKRRQQLNSIC